MNERAEAAETTPLAGLGRILTVVLAADAVLWAVGLFAAQNRLSAVNAVPSGLWTSDPNAANARLNNANTFDAVVFAAGLVLLAGTAVVFLMWMYRARANADVYRGSERRLGTYWAVGGWFVPLADLVLPLMVMLGIWKDSEITPRTRIAPVTWWTTFVLAVLGRIAGTIDWDTHDHANYGSAAGLDMFAALMFVTSAIFGILTIRMITGWQGHRDEELARARRPKSKKARQRRTATAG